MPLNFTRLAGDSLSGPNANPLNASVWTQVVLSGDNLEIFSHQCTPTISFDASGGSVYSGISWPNDQWAEVQLNSLLDDLQGVAVYVRADIGIVSGYFFAVAGPFNDTTGDSVFSVGSLGTGFDWIPPLPITLKQGDTIRIAAVGTTLYGFLNGVQFFAADLTADPGGVVASGSAALLLQNGDGVPVVGQVGVVNFSGGSVAEEEFVPAYVSSPFSLRTALLPGIPFYSYGSFDDRTPPTRMQVTSVAITSNVATVAVKILEGLIPIPAALISIEGTQTLSGLFNVTNVALIAVVIDLTTGIGHVTFSLTHADVATTSDSGVALVPQPEIPDLYANGSGLQGAVPFQSGLEDSGKTISWWYKVAGSPSTGTLALQGADIDQDGYYEKIDSVDLSATTQGTRNVSPPQNYAFLRMNVSNASGGTNPTIIAGFEI
jgi:hypothetical protein